MRQSSQWYDGHVRDQRSREFYNSQEWRAVRDYKLSLNPLCELCIYSLNGQITRADLVHHLLEISTPEGWERRLEVRYLQSLCLECHNTVEAERKAQRKRD